MRADRPFGPYILGELLGEGSTGRVYRAHRRGGQDGPVALKILSLSSPGVPNARERFLRECSVLMSLDHPSIIRAHDTGEIARQPYLVMDLLPAGTLEAHLELRKAVSAERVLSWGRDLLNALEYIHDRGYLHRDVKPSNIMFSPEGRAVLMDFGLVRALDVPGLTRQGAVVGTPLYMAPEVLGGQEATQRSDLFSLGLVMFRCLVGREAYGIELVRAATGVTRSVPALPSVVESNPALDRSVENWLINSVAWDPAHRYSSAGEMRDDLQALLEGRTVGPRPCDKVQRGEPTRALGAGGEDESSPLPPRGEARGAAACLLASREGRGEGPPDPGSAPSHATRPTRFGQVTRALQAEKTLLVVLSLGSGLALAILGGYVWWRFTPPSEGLVARPGSRPADLVTPRTFAEEPPPAGPPVRPVSIGHVDFHQGYREASWRFQTDRPVVTRVICRPSGADGETLERPRTDRSSKGREHSLTVSGLPPERAHEAVLEAQMPGGTWAPLWRGRLPAAAERIETLLGVQEALDVPRIVKDVSRARLTVAEVRRMLQPHAEALPVVRGAMEAPEVSLRVKASLYRALVQLGDIEAACDLRGEVLGLGAADSAGGLFEQRIVAQPPERVDFRHYVPQPQTFLPLGTKLDGFFQEVGAGTGAPGDGRGEYTLSVPLSGVTERVRARVILSTHEMEYDLRFDVSINDELTLALRNRRGSYDREGVTEIQHAFPAAFLREGNNQITVALRALPGVGVVVDTAGLLRIDLLVE